jgi:hypothetical protein
LDCGQPFAVRASCFAVLAQVYPNREPLEHTGEEGNVQRVGVTDPEI